MGNLGVGFGNNLITFDTAIRLHNLLLHTLPPTLAEEMVDSNVCYSDGNCQKIGCLK
jgi:hypothetical protein